MFVPSSHVDSLWGLVSAAPELSFDAAELHKLRKAVARALMALTPFVATKQRLVASSVRHRAMQYNQGRDPANASAANVPSHDLLPVIADCATTCPLKNAPSNATTGVFTPASERPPICPTHAAGVHCNSLCQYSIAVAGSGGRWLLTADPVTAPGIGGAIGGATWRAITGHAPNHWRNTSACWVMRPCR